MSFLTDGKTYSKEIIIKKANGRLIHSYLSLHYGLDENGHGFYLFGKIHYWGTTNVFTHLNV